MEIKFNTKQKLMTAVLVLSIALSFGVSNSIANAQGTQNASSTINFTTLSAANNTLQSDLSQEDLDKLNNLGITISIPQTQSAADCTTYDVYVWHGDHWDYVGSVTVC